MPPERPEVPFEPPAPHRLPRGAAVLLTLGGLVFGLLFVGIAAVPSAPQWEPPAPEEAPPAVDPPREATGAGLADAPPAEASPTPPPSPPAPPPPSPPASSPVATMAAEPSQPTDTTDLRLVLRVAAGVERALAYHHGAEAGVVSVERAAALAREQASELAEHADRLPDATVAETAEAAAEAVAGLASCLEEGDADACGAEAEALEALSERLRARLLAP